MDVADVLFNPRNWRTHPDKQRGPLRGALREVGWVQSVIVNKRTGHLVDGHLRVLLADEAGQRKVPVTYVDLSPEEEAKVLATLDPIGALAGKDSEKLEDLLASLIVDDEELRKMIGGMTVAPESLETASVDLGARFEVSVECASETEQSQVFERLTKEGYKCRVLSL